MSLATIIKLLHLKSAVLGESSRAAQGKLISRALRLQPLEDRLAPSIGDVLSTLIKPNAASGDQFGAAVAGLGNNIIAGTPGDDMTAGNSGAVFLMDPTTREALLTIPNPTPFAGDNFGAAVASVGGNILVGAPKDNALAVDSGAVYLFDGSSGALLLTLTNPSPSIGDSFGKSVASVGGNILVSAPFDDTGAIDSGAVYLFDGTTGALLLTILNPTPAVNDQFGSAITSDGTNILAGAPLDNTKFVDSGSAYVFDGTTGALLRTINNPVPAVGDQFGYSLTTLPGKVVVGAPFDDANAADSGSVYLFDLGNGKLIKNMANPLPEGGDQFGFSLASVGSNFVAGAPRDKTAAAVASGSVFFVDGMTGNVIRNLLNPGIAAQDMFGYSVASIQNNIVVGTPFDNSPLIDSGSVHLISAVTYVVPNGTGPRHLIITGDINGRVVIDLDTNEVLVSESGLFAQMVIIGSDDSDEIIVKNVFDDLNLRALSISGGSGGTDRIDVWGGGGTNARYLPDAQILGGGTIMLSTNASATPNTSIGFSGFSSIGIREVITVELVTQGSSDNLLVDAGVGPLEQPANIVSGTSDGVAITPLTVSNSFALRINTSLNDASAPDDTVSVSDAGWVGVFEYAQINTGAGNDELIVSSDDFLLPGNLFAFEFAAGSGSDQLTSLSGVDLSLNRDFLRSSNGGDLIFSGLEKAVLIGNSGDRRLAVEANTAAHPVFPGLVTLIGGDGNDTLIGGPNKNLLLGGAGDDVLLASLKGSATLDGGSGDDTITGGNYRDSILGGDGDDSIHAGGGDDFIDGGDGFNSLFGDAGNDSLISLSGDDSLNGGNGNDTLDSGEGDDLLDGAAGNDLIDGGIGNDIMAGGTGNDTINGDSGDDAIDGGSGNNRIVGGDGNDNLFAGSGVDFLDGGDGDDSLSGGAGNDTLFAGAGTDTLNGEAGNDLLDGGDGADALLGGTGRDVLIGGSGADFMAGNGEDDLLISSLTDFSGNLAALNGIIAEWTRPVVSYATRVSHLTTGGGLNGPFLLGAATVHDDGSIDHLLGEAGKDWFVANLNDLFDVDVPAGELTLII